MGSLLRRRWLLVGLAVVVVAAGLVWLLWPAAPGVEQPRERRYRAYTACLLADERSVGAEPAKSVWAGMQEVSAAQSVKVQYLSVPGPQTSANAVAYFNTLGLQRCEMIIAVGDAPVGAMAAGKQQFPGIACVAVGGHVDGPADGHAVTTVDGSSADAARARVVAILTEAAKAAP